MVVTAHDVDTYDAHTLALVRSMAIRPVPLLPAVAAISPDGAAVAIGFQNGSVAFVDAATGAARRGLGGHGAAVASALYAPDGRTVVTVGDDGKAIVWDPGTGAQAAVLPGPVGHLLDAKASPVARRSTRPRSGASCSRGISRASGASAGARASARPCRAAIR